MAPGPSVVVSTAALTAEDLDSVDVLLARTSLHSAGEQRVALSGRSTHPVSGPERLEAASGTAATTTGTAAAEATTTA